jgi:hypothetical protein
VEVRDDVRVALLIANRQAGQLQRQLEREPDVSHQLLGALPRELLHAVLLEIASGRTPPPAAKEWELFNDGDDGLPADWQARVMAPPAYSAETTLTPARQLCIPRRNIN